MIAPLHWGLGHATRCIPIIDHYIQLGKQVSIAGDSESFELLKRKYPNLDNFALPSYNITYGSSMTMSMLLQGSKLIKTYIKEQKAIKKIVSEWKPDVIISDNRFGAKSKNTYNIYLTHQLNIQHDNKLIALTANLLNRNFIHGFDECWVPDYKDKRLSGRLSDSSKITIPCHYIGPLSRLKLSLKSKTIDLLILLSGPEPSRTNLEKSLVRQLNFGEKKITLVRGSSAIRLAKYPANINVLDIVDQVELTNLINSSAAIISRSGYSTIMDLQQYSRPKYYIPTSGQTEQEYLAKYHDGTRSAIAISTIEELINHLSKA